MAGHEDLSDHPVPVSFPANITLSWFAWGGMGRHDHGMTMVTGASRGHGTTYMFTGYWLPTAEEQVITT